MKREAKSLVMVCNMSSLPTAALLKLPAFSLKTEADTARLAAAYAAQLGAGDVMLLSGGLAAGKTSFVRAFAAALGMSEGVSSPTYTLVNLYPTSTVPLLHMDAYRLENVAEFYDLGLEDELETRISLIEWGGKLAAEFDEVFELDLQMTNQSGARLATVSARGPRAQATLPAILERFRRATP